MKRPRISKMCSLAVVLAAVVLLLAAGMSFAIPDGDLTGDGSVTIADALRALRISVQLVQPNPQDTAQGDVAPQVAGLPAPDGNITIADALLILRKVVGLVNWPSDISALLTGDQETPPVVTSASGVGTISVNPVTKIISGGILTTGIIGTAAHIHDGDPGVPGPIIIPLTGGPTVWTIPDNTPITDAQLARLLAGGLYYNVHSVAFGGGEIRGQLPRQVRFASLSGADEVPPVITAAAGTAVLELNPVTKLLSGFIKTTNIVGTAAHIHTGAAGVPGPVIVPLVETPPLSGIWAVPPNSVLTDPQIALFNIGSLYYNVHSVANPNGEIRGQIVPTTITVKTALLDGAQEVPSVITAATGTGVAVLNSVTREVGGDVTTTGVVGTAANIHEGAVGATGLPIVTLTETVAGSGVWFARAGSPTLTAAQAAEFIAGALYYNVLSVANPTGEIRGQINVIPLNSSFLTGGGIATAAPLVSFSASIQPIFTTNCIACHATGSLFAPFLPLTAGVAYGALVNQPATHNFNVPASLVAPGNSAASVLYQRISGIGLADVLLARMPQGGPFVSAFEENLVKTWIDQGAANN
jgi:hypothetical protein